MAMHVFHGQGVIEQRRAKRRELQQRAFRRYLAIAFSTLLAFTLVVVALVAGGLWALHENIGPLAWMIAGLPVGIAVLLPTIRAAERFQSDWILEQELAE